MPLQASQPAVFQRYEEVRQALLAGNVKSVQTSAKSLAAAAKSAKLSTLATHAIELSVANDTKTARAAFGVVSADLIRFRNEIGGDKPVVLYCSMEKKSWLQPEAKPVTNPYVDPSMRGCGEVRR